MPAKKISSPAEIYQIKVTLLGSDPPVWRWLLVPCAPDFVAVARRTTVRDGMVERPLA
jgi:hypothetical protein